MKKVKYNEWVGYKRLNNRDYRMVRMYEEKERWIDDDGMREYSLKGIEDCIKESFEDMGRYDVEINIYNLI